MAQGGIIYGIIREVDTFCNTTGLGNRKLYGARISV